MMSVKPLCRIRDIQKSLEVYAQIFQQQIGLGLKEAMVLCSLSEALCTSTEIAMKMDLTCSNCSKILGALEQKGYVQRQVGEDDRRNMFFGLTSDGLRKLADIERNMPRIPEFFL